MRALVFAKRNAQEILRDPLSYVFCLALPVVMLVVFYGVFYSPEVPLFAIDNLAPGITVFSFAFVMLYMTILVSKDRATSFLSRLFTSPMTTLDFVLGYAIPGLVIALGQILVCFGTAAAIGLIAGTPLSVTGIVLNIFTAIPAMVMFIGFGILFGSIFSDKTAPGMSSIIITMSGFLSGAWTPVDPNSTLGLVFTAFPFYPATSVGRIVLGSGSANPAGFWTYLSVVCVYAVAVFTIAVLVFKKKMVSDNT